MYKVIVIQIWPPFMRSVYIRTIRHLFITTHQIAFDDNDSASVTFRGLKSETSNNACDTDVLLNPVFRIADIHSEHGHSTTLSTSVSVY